MAGIIVDNNVLNQANTPVLLADVISNLPPPGLIGRIFISTDTHIFLRDYGTTWVQIGGSGGGGGGFIPYTGANQSIDLGYNSFLINGIAIYNQYNQNNIGIGQSNLGINTTGQGNVAIGSAALNQNLSGDYNVAIGFNSLVQNDVGSSNVSIGVASLQQNQSGYSNIAIGNSAMNQNINGYQNIGIGASAGLYLITGFENIFIGTNAGGNLTNGNDNIFIGNFGNNYQLLTNNGNILIGTNAAGVLLANYNEGLWETKDCIAQIQDNTAIGNVNFLQSELTLGTGQTVLPSAPVTIDTAIKLNINGVDYWLQASTTPPVNTSTIGIQNNTGNALINFDAVANGSNIIGLSPNIVLGTGLTNGSTTALLIGTNTILLSNATQPFSVVNVQDYATTGSLAYDTSIQPNNSVTLYLYSITGPIIADGILITIA